jgi:hypothetical protein
MFSNGPLGRIFKDIFPQNRLIKEIAQWRGAVFIKRLEFLSLWSDPKGDSKVIRAKEKKWESSRTR